MTNSLNPDTRQFLKSVFRDTDIVNKVVAQTEKSPLLTDMLNSYSARNGKIEIIPGPGSKCSPDGNTIGISENAVEFAKYQKNAIGLISALSEELSHAVLPNGTNVTAGPNYNEFIDRASESEAVGWNGRYIVLCQCGIADTDLFLGERSVLAKQYEDAGIDIQKIGYEQGGGLYHIRDGISVPIDTSRVGAVDYLKGVVPAKYSQKWDAEYLIINSGYDAANADQEYLLGHNVSWKTEAEDGTRSFSLNNIPYTCDGDVDKLDLSCKIDSDGYMQSCTGTRTLQGGSTISTTRNWTYDESNNVTGIEAKIDGRTSAGELTHEQRINANSAERLNEMIDLDLIAREVQEYENEDYSYSLGPSL